MACGCVNQAGKDNRNVARMALPLAGLPATISGAPINRPCGSGMDAFTAPSVRDQGRRGQDHDCGRRGIDEPPAFRHAQGGTAFSRGTEIHGATIGLRFVIPLMEKMYGTHSMPETAENLAQDYGISHENQAAFAASLQAKATAAQANGRLALEIFPLTVRQRKGDPVVVDPDKQPRPGTTAENWPNGPRLFARTAR